MHRPQRILWTLVALVVLAAAAPTQSLYDVPRWPQWRGGDMDGVAPEANPPLTWSEQENVVWKIDLPGPASATPVVWEAHMFVQSARDVGDGVIEFLVHALDRETGDIVWERAPRTERPGEGIQPNNTWASGSPVVDEERVYAFFGSRGIYAYTHDGELVWEADLGDMQTRRGFGEGLSGPAWVLVGLLGAQILLGATMIWTVRHPPEPHPELATAHQVTGALILAAAFYLAVRLLALPATRREWGLATKQQAGEDSRPTETARPTAAVGA